MFSFLLTSFSCRKSSHWYAADSELPWSIAPSYIYNPTKSVANFACTTSYSCSFCSEWQQQYRYINLHFNRFPGPLEQILPLLC